MGLMDMSSFSPAWLDANWRTLERDGGQVFFYFSSLFFFNGVFTCVSVMCVCVYR